MATAVDPPPAYFSPLDVCHIEHTSDGYSKQVMPPPFKAYDQPEKSTDDTMILFDVSGSMDFDPVRPIYDQYLITGYVRSTQPKNKCKVKSSSLYLLTSFSCCKSCHQTIHRCHAKPRSYILWLRFSDILQLIKLCWHGHTFDSWSDLAKNSIWWRNTSHDWLAKS